MTAGFVSWRRRTTEAASSGMSSVFDALRTFSAPSAEDTTTTGNSPLTAAAALREAGADVVGVATVVDRATGAADVIREQGLEYRYLLGLTDLGLE